MKFQITTTSRTFDEDTPPCDGAVYERFTRVDRRTCTSFAEFQKSQGQDFLARGENHRIELDKTGAATGIARDFPGEAGGWFLNVPTLDGLIAFADEHGELVIGRSGSNPSVRMIEIYDDYRE